MTENNLKRGQLDAILVDVAKLKERLKDFGVSREISIARQHLDNVEMWCCFHYDLVTGKRER